MCTPALAIRKNRDHDFQRTYQVRRVFQQVAPVVQRFIDQRQLTVLQIAQTAVNEAT